MQLPLSFHLAQYRFVLRVEEPLILPGYKGGMLRGGFGYVFKRLVCIYRPQCLHCQLVQTCPYGYIFETTSNAEAPFMAKDTDVPVPFVIEPPLDARREYNSGDTLEFHLVLIGKAIQYLPYFVVVFTELGKQGLGAERGHARLEEVYAVQPITRSEKLVARADGALREQDLTIGVQELANTDTVTQAQVRFLSPTRLKFQKGLVTSEPPFEALARALLRRVSALAFFHCGEQWDTDFRAWVERAAQVRTVSTNVRWVDWERYSTRQKQTMNLGGIVGETTYEGDLGAFMPLLRLGELVHVGKTCAFGHGKYELI